MMKSVLVTGGAGIIGSHLCERLLARGYEVLRVDNIFTSRRQNISHLVGNPGEFTILELATMVKELTGPALMPRNPVRQRGAGR